MRHVSGKRFLVARKLGHSKEHCDANIQMKAKWRKMKDVTSLRNFEERFSELLTSLFVFAINL